MDISKIEKWSPSTNIYDDLRGVDSLSSPRIPSRTTSTIGYISSREIENTQIQQPTVSLILPVSTTASSSEQMITLDTIVSIDDTKLSSSSSSIESIEQENKVYKLVSIKKDQSCICWIVREIIQLICVALFASLIAMFAFTLIFYAFDIYWLEQPIMNNSLWWFYDDNNTNFTDFDYAIMSTTYNINYDDEY